MSNLKTFFSIYKKNTGAIREKTYTYVLKSNHFVGDADSGIARHKHQWYTLKVKLVVAVKFTYLRIV